MALGAGLGAGVVERELSGVAADLAAGALDDERGDCSALLGPGLGEAARELLADPCCEPALELTLEPDWEPCLELPF